MAEAAGISLIVNLVSQALWDGARAGLRARRERGKGVPEEEQHRRDSLESHLNEALSRSLGDVSEWSQEWTALYLSLRAETDGESRFVEHLVFGDGGARRKLLESDWVRARGADPARYQRLIAELVEAARWAVARDPALSHYFDLFRPRPEAPTRPTEPSTRFAVPFPSKGDGFVGRAGEMGELHRMLGGAGPVGIIAPAVKPAGVTGQGGIGKTQLAVEYAHAHREDYAGGVYWVDAAGDLVEGMARCAQFAGFGESGEDLSDLDVKRALAHDLYRWLQGHGDSLLILDNLANPTRIGERLFGEVVLRVLPCRLLFTTRSRAFDMTAFPTCELKVLPRGASLELLLGERKEAAQEEAGELSAGDEICRMLGDLALAVEQAEAYLRKWPQVSVSGYRDRLREEGLIATADDTPLTEEETATRHAVGLAVMLRQSVEGLAPNALLTLRVLAEFGENEMVPRHRVGLAAGLSTEARRGRPDALSVAVEELKTASLVDDLEGGRLRLHPLVREFARSLTPEAEREACRQRIAENFARGLGDVEYLERKVDERGVDAVLGDFRAAYRILAAEGDITPALLDMSRLVTVVAYGVRFGTERHPPGFFLQQVRNAALDVGKPAVQQHTEQLLLNRRGICYLLQREPQPPMRPSDAADWPEADAPGADVACFSPDGSMVAWGFSDGRIEVCSARRSPRAVVLRGHSKAVARTALSADNLLMASQGADNVVILWELASGEQVMRFPISGWVNGVSLSPGGRLLACGGADQSIHIWDCSSHSEVAVLSTEGVPVLGLDFAANRSCLVVSVPWARGIGSSRAGHLWDASGLDGRIGPPEPGVRSAPTAVSPDGRRFAGHLRPGFLMLAAVTDGVPSMSLLVDPRSDLVLFSPSGRFVISGGGESLQLREVQTGRLVARYRGSRRVDAIWWSPDGRLIRMADCGWPVRIPHVSELDLVGLQP